MDSPIPLRRIIPLFLSLASVSVAQTVTIKSDIPDNNHLCIEECLDYNYVTDIGDILECGEPYENNCYCATASASASVASAFINECASERCAAGDLTRDISSIRSIYASYCIGAGFTQPIISQWYTAADGPDDSEETESTAAEPERTSTEDSVPAETTTRLTVVTETTEAEGEGGTTASRVIVDVTSTVWVNAEGSVVSGPGEGSSGGGSDNTTTIGLGVGLGVGLPVVFGVIGVGIWLCLRKRRRDPGPGDAAHVDASSPHELGSSQPMHMPIARKPVAVALSTPTQFQSDKSELSAPDVKSEISGREIHQLSDTTRTPSLATPAHHEVHHEVPANSWSHDTEASRYHNAPYELSGR